MTFREITEKLAGETSKPCVTISLNTHRTHSDNLQDDILLKKLVREAEVRLTDEFGKRAIEPILENLGLLPEKININYNLDSLHIYVSANTLEIVRSVWPVSRNAVYISDQFALRPLIKASNRSEEYLIMLLSQNGVYLYEALNDTITGEVTGQGFPIEENPYYETEKTRRSDPKRIDNMVREFFNKTDKVLVKVHLETGLQCVVVCTEDNYSRLMQVADNKEVYLGYSPIDYNNIKPHQISSQSYEIILEEQQKRRTNAIVEIREAVATGRVITDLQEIYRAAIDGRGELLLVHQDFVQAVIMTDDRSFSMISDPNQPDSIEDITDVVAWEVISKKGRVIFYSGGEIEGLGSIALKTRY